MGMSILYPLWRIGISYPRQQTTGSFRKDRDFFVWGLYAIFLFFRASLQREKGRVECIDCCLMRDWHIGSEIFTTTSTNNGVIMAQLVASQEASNQDKQASFVQPAPSSGKQATQQSSKQARMPASKQACQQASKQAS